MRTGHLNLLLEIFSTVFAPPAVQEYWDEVAVRMDDLPIEFTEDQLVPARELNRREGHSVAALMGYQRYRKLRKLEAALEEAALILEARRRLRNFAANPNKAYSLDEVVGELGLINDDEVEG